MEIFECINTRRSVRRFTNKKISQADFETMLRAAGMAPSPCNSQPWVFIVNKRKEVVEEIKDLIAGSSEGSRFVEDYRAFSTAPYIITVCQDTGERWYQGKDGEDLNIFDRIFNNQDVMAVSAAVENLLLAAHALGLGACWIATNSLYREKQEKLLNIKWPYRLATNIAIGYPAEKPSMPNRKPLEKFSVFIN